MKYKSYVTMLCGIMCLGSSLFAEDRLSVSGLWDKERRFDQYQLRYTKALDLNAFHGHFALDGKIWSRYDHLEWNLGLLYRKPVQDAWVGVYGYFDHMRMRYDGDHFSTATLGAEWLNHTLHLSANATLPLYNHQVITPTPVVGTDIVLYRPEKKGYYGLDVSIQKETEAILQTPLSARVGYKVWHHSQLQPSHIAGMFAELRWKPKGVQDVLGKGKALSFYTQFDATMPKKRWTFGVEASYSRIKGRTSKARFLETPVYRDPHIRVGEKKPDFDYAKKVINQLMDVYVINLDKHTERLENMGQMLNEGGIDMIRMPAVNGRERFATLQDLIDSGMINMDSEHPEVVASLKGRSSWVSMLRNVLDEEGKVKDDMVNQKNNLAGHVGCSESHRKTLERSQNSSKPYVFVLEDDAQYVADPKYLPVQLMQIIEEHQRNKLDADFIVLHDASKQFSGQNLEPFKEQSAGSHSYLVPTERTANIMRHLKAPYAGYYDLWWGWEEAHGLKRYGAKEVLFPRSATTSEAKQSSSTGY